MKDSFVELNEKSTSRVLGEIKHKVLRGGIGSTNRHYYQEDYEEVISMTNKSYSGIAWKGDVVSSEIILATEEAKVTNINISSSDFINEYNDIISSENVDVIFMKYVSAHIGRGTEWGKIPDKDIPRIMVPDVLDTFKVTDINENMIQPIWININIPKNANVGIYNGTISITGDFIGEDLNFSYNIEVLDILQPEVKESTFYLDLWQYPFSIARYYDVIPFSEEHFHILEPHLKPYKDAGGKAITATIVEDPWNHQTYDGYPSMVKWSRLVNGEFIFNYSIFDKWVNFNLKIGINDRINCFSIVPWENRIMFYDENEKRVIEEKIEPGSNRWIEIWKPFIKDFVEHLDLKGWFDITYIAMDERPMDTMIPVLELLEQIKNKNGKTLKVSGAMDYNALDNNILDKVHDISINLGHIDHNDKKLKELAERRRNLGLNTTLYTCVGNYPNSFARSNPSESAWTIWYAASHGLDGFLRWAYDAWTEDPLVSLDHWYWESGDTLYVYPGNKSERVPRPKSSPRFEKLKEGIRDIVKVNFIRKTCPELKEKIDKLLLSVGRVYGKLNEWNAMEAGSSENINFIDNEVNRLRSELMKVSREYIEINNK